MKVFVSKGAVGWAHLEGTPYECFLVTLRMSYMSLPGGHLVVAVMETDTDKHLEVVQLMPPQYGC